VRLSMNMSLRRVIANVVHCHRSRVCGGHGDLYDHDQSLDGVGAASG
jgi:hypothetical protein